MKKTLLFAFVLILIIPITYAYNSASIPLLTVSELDNNTQVGGVAKLQLVVEPGSGRIFIDSFPLSKVDTQITFRFATEVACDLLQKDCSGYDFFYTITANTGLVGGPSAGAAATVLTVALLDNQKLDNETVMTGTINSGNLIGPVAGVPAKVLAAQKLHYKRALVPEWDIVNETLDSNLQIQVIPIATLEDALYYFTGKNYTKKGVDAEVNSTEYSMLMQNITAQLCTKYGSEQNGTLILPNITSYGINLTNDSNDNFQLALAAINNHSYYSAASLCFGGNVRIEDALLRKMSQNALKAEYAKTLTDAENFIVESTEKFDNISTISQLETYMIVSERMYDARSVLTQMDPNNISTAELAYAKERLYTAKAWSLFSSFSGPKFNMDKNLLLDACTKKLSEAEERLNYLELYYPNNDIRPELLDSYKYYENGNYAMCIFSASKVKADSDIVLSAIFVPQNELDRLLQEKLDAAKRAINSQQKDNVFPILGYSYYEYANTLKSTDQYSALLYSEYALEMSNLDMYFRKYEPLKLSNLPTTISRSRYFDFFVGLFIGVLLSSVIILLSERSRLKEKKRRR